MPVCFILKAHTPLSHILNHQRGKKMDDTPSLIACPRNFLSCCLWCLFLSLTTPLLTSTVSPPFLQQLFVAALAQGAGGPLSVAVCCMLALSSSSPPSANNPVEVLFRGDVLVSFVQPFCYVNPHCLVSLFELTWMLLFGFSACGSFYLFFFVSESMLSCF